MHVSALRLNNFCGFSKFRVPFNEFNVLVGPNNGGKTTVLRAIRMVFDAVEMTAESYAQQVRNWQSGADGLANREREQLEATRAALDSQPHLNSQAREQQLKNVAGQFRGQRDQLNRQFPKWQCDVARLVQRYALDASEWLHFRHLAHHPASLELDTQTVLGSVNLRLEISDPAKAAITCALDGQDLSSLPPDKCEALIARLGKSPCLLSYPAKNLYSSEQAMPWPQVQDDIAKGKDDGVWRNLLHWLYDGRPPEGSQRVVGRVQQAMPSITVRPPGRTRDRVPKVVVTYNEDGHEFDIAEAGAGLRTYLSVVASVELSEAPVLLFDEPDCHLHSSVQRQLAEFLESQASDTRQIIVATHAPDMIDQFTLESLLWIDRSIPEARRCDDLPKTMVELGAISHAQAIECVKADALIYFEAKPDRKVFESLLAKCGFGDMLRGTQLATLGGFGDIEHLRSFVHIASKHHQRHIAVAVIRDGDYDPPGGEEGACSPVLVVRLPCKEIENLLLVSPEALEKAAARAAERRQDYTSGSCRPPTLGQIERFIDEVTASDAIRAMVEANWIAKRLRPRTDGGDLSRQRDAFGEHWKDPAFRRRFGPGKAVLARLRQWLQRDWKVSLNSPFECYEPSEDLMAVFRSVQEHFKRHA